MNNEYIKQYYKEHSLNKNKIPVNIIEYLNTQFIDKSGMDIIDKLLCILNDTNDVPRCPICGKPCKRDGYKYHKSCGNSKCIYGLKKQSMIKKYGVANPFQLESVKEKIKKTNIERYGVDNPAKSQKVWDKIKATNLEKYGTEYVMSNDSIKEKVRQTCIKKYGVDNVKKSELIKKHTIEHNLEKYGVEYPTQLQSTIDKIHESKTKHKTHTCSKEEDKVYELLKTMYNDIRRQYKSEDYPFACDFYIADNDLYIECNFHWTHGKHCFDKNDPDDIKKLNLWKKRSKEKDYYISAIDVWTNRDIMKREIVEKHGLNYLEFFSFSELKNYFYALNKKQA